MNFHLRPELRLGARQAVALSREVEALVWEAEVIVAKP
jgi:hypothetical protein